MAWIRDENLIEHAFRQRKIYREKLNENKQKHSLIREVRGKGLLNAIELDHPEESSTAWDICLKMMENGLLAKPTHGNKIRFAPPLVITEEQLEQGIDIIRNVFEKHF